MRNFWMTMVLSIMLLAAPGIGMARAESSTVVNDRPPAASSIGSRGFHGQNAMADGQQTKVSDTAEEQRRKQLSDETAKLLQLATELKAAVDKSNKNEMSLEVIRKADDVEKLAHDLKLKMRSSGV